MCPQFAAIFGFDNRSSWVIPDRDVTTHQATSQERSMRLELLERRIVGSIGELIFPPDDVITPRLMMLPGGRM